MPHHRTGLPAAVDKHTARSAAAERLDAKLARTRKQVQHTSARQKELDGAEHALLDTVHRGPCDLFTGQRGQPCAARGTGNNAHLILLIRTGGLAAAPHILSFRLFAAAAGKCGTSLDFFTHYRRLQAFCQLPAGYRIALFQRAAPCFFTSRRKAAPAAGENGHTRPAPPPCLRLWPRQAVPRWPP